MQTRQEQQTDYETAWREAPQSAAPEPTDDWPEELPGDRMQLAGLGDDLIGKVFGKRGDGVSMQTHKAMKEAGVGKYEDEPAKPAAPTEGTGTFGPRDTDAERAARKAKSDASLREMLRKRGDL